MLVEPGRGAFSTAKRPRSTALVLGGKEKVVLGFPVPSAGLGRVLVQRALDSGLEFFWHRKTRRIPDGPKFAAKLVHADPGLAAPKHPDYVKCPWALPPKPSRLIAFRDRTPRSVNVYTFKFLERDWGFDHCEPIFGGGQKPSSAGMLAYLLLPHGHRNLARGSL